MRKMPGTAFAEALEAAGIISDLNNITRLVIVVEARDMKLYVERFGDDRLVDVAALLTGAEVIESGAV